MLGVRGALGRGGDGHAGTRGEGIPLEKICPAIKNVVCITQ